LNKQKQNGNQQRRLNVDKSFASRKRLQFKKLLAEFPNKAFGLIPAVFIVLKTGIFSVSSKK